MAGKCVTDLSQSPWTARRSSSEPTWEDEDSLNILREGAELAVFLEDGLQGGGGGFDLQI
jgi:hypothetical protein